MDKNVWNQGVDVEWYEQKKDVRERTFRFLQDLICVHRVKSILEVGGGHGYLADTPGVERYVGVELNDTVVPEATKRPHVKMIAGDWLAIDEAPLIGQFDAFLAIHVVQHCPDYRPFVKKALRVRPRLLAIGFFGIMSCSMDHYNFHRKALDKKLANGQPYIMNNYSRGRMEEWLDAIPQVAGHYRFERFGRRDERRDHVLVMTPDYEA